MKLKIKKNRRILHFQMASPQELENSETQTARNAKRQERKWSGTRNDVISSAFFSNKVINMSEANHPTRKFDAPFMF